MPLSTGTKSLLSEIASWAACALVIAAVVINFDELRGLIRNSTGMAPVEASAATSDDAAEPQDQLAKADGIVELKAQANGHYYAEVEVNGRPIDVLVDTGATMVALTFEDAEKAGIYLDKSDFSHSVSTANGVSRVASVTLGSVTLGGITVRNVKAAVVESGKLQTTLLGMTFLGRLERVDMRSGTLVLQN